MMDVDFDIGGIIFAIGLRWRVRRWRVRMMTDFG